MVNIQEVVGSNLRGRKSESYQVHHNREIPTLCFQHTQDISLPIENAEQEIGAVKYKGVDDVNKLGHKFHKTFLLTRGNRMALLGHKVFYSHSYASYLYQKQPSVQMVNNILSHQQFYSSCRQATRRMYTICFAPTLKTHRVNSSSTQNPAAIPGI